MYQLSGIPGMPTMTYSVDGEGRPNTVTASSGQNPVVVNGSSPGTSYNAASQVTQMNLGSGDSDAFTFDPNTGRMRQYQFNVNGQSEVGNLTWNALGTLKTLAITDPFNSSDAQTCTYAHDDLVRITSNSCTSNPAWSQTFTYDPFGNIAASGTGSFQAVYSSATNRMTQIAGQTPTYDTNGNVTNDFLHTFSWDADGHAITISGISVTYDALGRAVERNTSGSYSEIVFAPAGGKLAVMNGQVLVLALIPLPNGSVAEYWSGGTLYYRHPDWLGSSRLVSTSTRTIRSDEAYSPFGVPYNGSGTSDVSFTGMDQDTTANLYDFPAREYGIQGRWPSPDPAGMAAVDPTNPQSLNRYAYVMNNPLAFIDPFGLYLVCRDGDTYDEVDFQVDGQDAGSDYTFVKTGCGPPTFFESLWSPGGGGGGRGPSVTKISKDVNHCAAELSQTKSASALFGVPEWLGSNSFGDFSSLATGDGGVDQAVGLGVDYTMEVTQHAAAQYIVTTVPTLAKPVSGTLGVYNPISASTSSQLFGGTLKGKILGAALEGVSQAKLAWDAAMYLGAEAVCAAPAWTY